VLDPEQDVQRLLAPACHIYRLSAAESRLVCHIVSGSSLSEAAGDLRIQLHTARTYLKKIFFKTQTNRQAELVRVMLSSLLRTNSRIDLSLL
jgi:DNA-binding CsgD family transcriptional regulator